MHIFIRAMINLDYSRSEFSPLYSLADGFFCTYSKCANDSINEHADMLSGFIPPLPTLA